MVNRSIKVFARLRNQGCSDKIMVYQIVKKEQDFDDIFIYSDLLQQGSNPYSFRFHKVFDQKSNQEDVFDNVAKPVINSVLQGFNGTIFAYGQTGSGKTYSITGSPKNYNDRGIIPRSIQYVFSQNEKITIKPTMYISYMEIYNEVGYDLLSLRADNSARSLEDLPRIVLLEDSNGEVHMRNLSVLPVTTEEEAMRLLFLGDTNRIIAETPMNEYSSRSHCIFTIYLTFRDEPSNILRYSKLHLIDLAGSERVSKSLTTGSALREAKHINLSLHYLQQVILALSESKRHHIPYRNSMMTYILKDSLSGNCLTAMLATLALTKENIQETISTCRFAQRVSMISTAPVINEIRDPQKEIMFLRNTIDDLRKQISQMNSFSKGSVLGKHEEEACKMEVERYLSCSLGELKVEPIMSHIQFCFKLMRNKINTHNLDNQERQLECAESQKELTALKRTIDKQDAEINNLKKIIDEMPENPISLNNNKKSNLALPEANLMKKPNQNVIVNCLTGKQDQFSKDKQQLKSPSLSSCDSELRDHEKQMFELFIRKPENSKDLEYYTQNLQKKLEMAKIYADTIDQCQKNITYIRQQLQAHTNQQAKNKLITELEKQQKIYSKSLEDLKTLKNETYHLQSGLKKAEIKTMRHFKLWLENQENKSNKNSRTDLNKPSYAVEESDRYARNSKQLLRKSSSKECTCKVEVDKPIPVPCCSSVHVQSAPPCWTNFWSGNVCLGPVCQPLVVDKNQYYDRPSYCNLQAHICNSNSNVCSNVKVYQPNHISDTNHMHLEEPRKNLQNCQSCSYIQDQKDSRFVDVTNFSSEHYAGKKYLKERGKHSIKEGRYNKQINDTEEYETNSCIECIKDSLIQSRSNTEQCSMCSSSSLDVDDEDKHCLEDEPCLEDDPKGDESKNSVGEVYYSELFKETDSVEFKDFMKTIPSSGDVEIDKEIFNFYRNKFCS